ncbi:MAG: hypothetical protein QHJ73_05500, partial [Armatimonadota bacterium]|nr:hypothetical protein [Armatimonadota bacterium]
MTRGWWGLAAEAAPLAALLVLALSALWPAAQGRSLPYAGDLGGSDLTELNWPRRVALARSLAAGRLPLWSDALHNGFPFHAEGQAGVLYPPTLILFGFLKPLTAFNWSLVLTLWGAGAFAYALARGLGGSRWGALLAGIAFMLSGFFVAHIKHVNLIQAGCWLPLLLLAVHRCFTQGRLRYAAGAGVVLTLMVLAGHPQIAYYSAVAAVMWAAGALCIGVTHAGARAQRWVRRLGFALVAVALMAGVCAALSAAQLLPTLELARVSRRAAGLTLTEATRFFPFRPADLLGLVWPFWQGNPAQGTFVIDPSRPLFWEGCAYVGLLPLALAALALARPRREAWLVAGVGLAALLLALGAWGGVYLAAWYVVPGMRFFRFPARFLLVAQLALAVLACFGLDALRSRFGQGWRRWMGGAACALAAGDLLLFAHAYIGWVDARAWTQPP